MTYFQSIIFLKCGIHIFYVQIVFTRFLKNPLKVIQFYKEKIFKKAIGMCSLVF